MSKKGYYTLTNDDQAQMDAFEKIADEDFLNPPPEQESSIDSWVGRLTRGEKRNLVTRKIVQKLESERMQSKDENS